VVDLWHADDKGEYDNIGFRYRGHVITGSDGAFRFRTIVPALYSGRTRHYHVKVQPPGSRLLTTQLYFPNEPANLRDGLFQRELLMQVADAGDGLVGRHHRDAGMNVAEQFAVHDGIDAVQMAIRQRAVTTTRSAMPQQKDPNCEEQRSGSLARRAGYIWCRCAVSGGVNGACKVYDIRSACIFED
jgi:hypothetical protein